MGVGADEAFAAGLSRVIRVPSVHFLACRDLVCSRDDDPGLRVWG